MQPCRTPYAAIHLGINALPHRKKASLHGKTAVVKGEDEEGKYEEYIIRLRYCLQINMECKNHNYRTYQ